MNTTEHLAAIVRHIDKLLAIAETRTPGEWRASSADDIGTDYKHPVRVKAGEYDVARNGTPGCFLLSGDATFIATCAGSAEAGWRATKAAIEVAFDCQSWDGMIKEMYIRPDAEAVINAILAAWPVELLKEVGA